MLSNDHPSTVVGPMPLIAGFWRKLGLDVVTDRLLGDDPRYNLTHGQRLCGLILNLLGGRRPLYKVERYYAESDVPLLLGEGVTSEDLNDDALLRTLDKIHKYGGAKLLQTICMHAATAEHVDLESVHWDSTSQSMVGEYENGEEGDLNITYGYNKDGRPDLKQFLYSLLVSKEGIPIWGAIRDGNKSDKNLNREVIDEISKAMTQEALKDMIYTGDSALATKKNFRKLDEQGLQFIIRFPKTFSECERTKLQALGEEAGWINIGTY